MSDPRGRRNDHGPIETQGGDGRPAERFLVTRRFQAASSSPARHPAGRSRAPGQGHQKPRGTLEIAHRVALHGRGSLLLLPSWDHGAADAECRASARRASRQRTRRTSPPRPTSPMATVPGFPSRIGLRAPYGEKLRPGRRPARTSRTPPAQLRKTSRWPRGSRARLWRTATSRLSRAGSNPRQCAGSWAWADWHGQRLHLHHQGPGALGGSR